GGLAGQRWAGGRRRELSHHGRALLCGGGTRLLQSSLSSGGAIMIARIAAIALALAAASATTAARAEDAVLANSVRIGAYCLAYDTTADDITGPYVPPGVNVKVKDVLTPYFAYVRRLSNHFSVELAAGLPPLTKTEGKGPAKLGSVPYNGQVISTARWLAPTLLLVYNFRDESAKLRPYIGAGINYTRFYSRQS